ncbi:MAG: tRNA-dihydrouridine synthase family protein [Desulfosarcina sp.]|nr:tRNA-dihydrouridine synthase family protein [Desulfobacterales bacterium]
MTPDQTLRQFLARPLIIRDREVRGRLFLAPMAKLGNTAFRKIVAAFGGYGLLFSEMCWARSVPCGNGHTQGGFTWRPDEDLSELVCQIFGNDPETMARAARIIANEGFFGVDLNFGCAVAAVCKKGCGAALLKTPARAAAIIKAVRRTVTVPLFVKFRTGWDDNPDRAVALARRFEDAGADALTFHPRVAPDRRTRPPRWEYIARVKAAVGVPVIGNGDVFERGDCEKMIALTRCDGVALGRLALARPWIFAEWASSYQPPVEIYLQSALELTEGLEACYGPRTAMRRFHRHAAYFTANFRYGHFLYGRLCRATDLAAVRGVLRQYLETDPDVLPRPSMRRLR